MALAVVLRAITPFYIFFSLFKVNAVSALMMPCFRSSLLCVISTWDAKSCAIVTEFFFSCARPLDEVR